MFECHGRRVRFTLPLPDRNDKVFTKDPSSTWREVSKEKAQTKYEQAVRQKWRCMTLAIKAKLEVVESGIATFEEEFMAHVVLPNGETVGQFITPQIAKTYESGQMPPLLLGAG